MSDSSAQLLEQFSDVLTARCAALLESPDLAVACSGGPDSMALITVLAHCVRQSNHNTTLHALIVDHGLRPGSDTEAVQTRDRLQDVPQLRPVILTWDGDKPETRIQEAARAARYELFSTYCRAHNIHHLFLAHHRDDQAETVLLRLAGGSGLDGLAGMRFLQPCGEDLTLVRPFLDVPKADLVALCDSHDIPYVQDPSNDHTVFARARLRQSRAVLAREGLTDERLCTTARRLARAQDALEWMAGQACEEAVSQSGADSLELNMDALDSYPAEIGFRVFKRGVQSLLPAGVSMPRLKRLEAVFDDLMDTSQPFRKRTLGGLVFERDETKSTALIRRR